MIGCCPGVTFVMLTCIPIHLFSPEVSFVPLRLDLRVKRGEGEALECLRQLFSNIEIGVSLLRLLDYVAVVDSGRKSPLLLVSF